LQWFSARLPSRAPRHHDGNVVRHDDLLRAVLVAGLYAYIAVATDAGGKMTATRVQITKDGVKPPQ